MAAQWDNVNSRPILLNHNGHQGQSSTFQAPLPVPDHPGDMKPPIPLVPEHHGRATHFGPPFAENHLVPIPYYEGYTIRPDDLASSGDRWSLPPKKSIPATQEDLHTEVVRQRQSDRTACRELEDCHGPKRLYIDRLIRERNACTSLGHFEVAQLRLDRIPKDYGKASNRNSGRNYHTRDHKQKDSTKPKQRTVYMHVILQFIKNPSRGLAEIPPETFAPNNPNVGHSHRDTRLHASDEDSSVYSISSDYCAPPFPEAPYRPVLARGYPYPIGEQDCSAPSSRTSRGTQTALINDPHGDHSSDGKLDDAILGAAVHEDNWTTASSVKEEISQKSPSSDDEIVSMGHATAVHECASQSTEEESRDIDEYEKPPWFQNLQPGLLLHLISNMNIQIE